MQNVMAIKQNKQDVDTRIHKPYYEVAGFVLYHANCLDILTGLPENSIDMVFADLPYFLLSGTFTCQNGKMVRVKKRDWDLNNNL